SVLLRRANSVAFGAKQTLLILQPQGFLVTQSLIPSRCHTVGRLSALSAVLKCHRWRSACRCVGLASAWDRGRMLLASGDADSLRSTDSRCAANIAMSTSTTTTRITRKTPA